MTEDGLLLIQGWAREGLSDEQIAKNIGINPATLYKWVDKYGEIGKAIKKGKAPVDFEVENALLKSALGHYVTIKEPIKVKKEMQKPGVGKVVEEHIEFVERQIYIPPNTVAQVFWLKNRKSDKWRDHPEIPISTAAIEKLDAILAQIPGDM